MAYLGKRVGQIGKKMASRVRATTVRDKDGTIKSMPKGLRNHPKIKEAMEKMKRRRRSRKARNILDRHKTK